ncbi:hypothetical protein [Chitinimonas koreensis]|uniref:hypothetical protein n=1 Tax=Chitinimonas koreensis TaxID=356302 RepID=UPI0003FD25FE|nr:hypothetical protein [Chitinimonas koreensis]QNM96195.1 hypothetical protein H9L41_20685 [Chitinimonas koreensis]
MSFVPATFSAPREWRHPLFQLQVLAPIHAEPDYEAVMTSADAIRHVFGRDSDWPDPQMSFEENRGDLERHETEFEQDVAYAYAMLDPAGERYLGCVYIRPIKSRIEGDLRQQRYQAQTIFWLSSLHAQIDAQQTLDILKAWIADGWPFERVAFPGREIDWPTWEAMARDATLAEPAAAEPR